MLRIALRLWLTALILLSVPRDGVASERLIAPARDADLIREVIAAEMPYRLDDLHVTGVTVPHHLLAPDLIARGLVAASAGTYERITILSPDHFGTIETPFGITTQPLSTVFGEVQEDRHLSDRLLGEALFSDIGSAEGEHGIHAIAPFLALLFPQTPVTAISIGYRSDSADWDRAIALLRDALGPRALIVQSTDYSHHLSVEQSILRDQESLGVIATGGVDGILGLDQPGHLDSKAAQYIQTALQGEAGATPVVIANSRSGDYVPFTDVTTSYIVTLWTGQVQRAVQLDWPDQDVLLIGGDTYLGRGWTPKLFTADGQRELAAALLRLTAGHDLVVNLEGVVLPKQPAGATRLQHFMPAAISLPVLHEAGIVAASLANNHSHDFGFDGLQETARALEGAGIRPLLHGEVVDLGPLRILPLTFLRSYYADHPKITDAASIDDVCSVAADPPLIAFVHWGEEFTSTPGLKERRELQTFAQCGFAAVIGAHSHRASREIETHAGGAMQSIFSLGNFLFDQAGPDVSGAMVEIRVFRSSTIALRLIPVPNFYSEQD